MNCPARIDWREEQESESQKGNLLRSICYPPPSRSSNAKRAGQIYLPAHLASEYNDT